MNTIFLDIDGTINAESARPPRNNTQWRGDWSREKFEKYWILWSHELVEALTALSGRPDVEVILLTDWSHKAPQGGELLGLPEFDYIPMVKPESGWWKLPHVQEIRRSRTGKVVWLDDLIPYWTEARGWALGRKDLLTISPNHHHGLSRKHIEMVNEFLDS